MIAVFSTSACRVVVGAPSRRTFNQPAAHRAGRCAPSGPAGAAGTRSPASPRRTLARPGSDHRLSDRRDRVARRCSPGGPVARWWCGCGGHPVMVSFAVAVPTLRSARVSTGFGGVVMPRPRGQVVACAADWRVSSQSSRLIPASSAAAASRCAHAAASSVRGAGGDGEERGPVRAVVPDAFPQVRHPAGGGGQREFGFVVDHLPLAFPGEHVPLVGGDVPAGGGLGLPRGGEMHVHGEGADDLLGQPGQQRGEPQPVDLPHLQGVDRDLRGAVHPGGGPGAASPGPTGPGTPR